MMPTSLTEVLVVIGLASMVLGGGLAAMTVGRAQVEGAARSKVGGYARLIDGLAEDGDKTPLDAPTGR